MRSFERNTEKPVIVLLCIAAVLVLVILAGTIYARVTGRGFQRQASAETSEGAASARTGEEERGFLDIGRSRVELSPEAGSETGALLIVKAAIPYPLSDGQFQEELASKLPEIRDAVRAFFSLYTLPELQGTPESELKAQLLKRLDRILVLGQPEDIYFDEFIFFE